MTGKASVEQSTLGLADTVEAHFGAVGDGDVVTPCRCQWLLRGREAGVASEATTVLGEAPAEGKASDPCLFIFV